MKNRNFIFLTILLALGCFALLQKTQAVTPAPDGGYANGNTAEGQNALFSLSTGTDNTANGALALYDNTTGYKNTATGTAALLGNTTGNNNTANGYDALWYNTIGNDNTANGVEALGSNTIGYDNTANGVEALGSNTSGHNNTAEGFQALLNNNGSSNIALGSNAGGSLTTGNGNVCIGAGVSGNVGESNTTRIRNVYSSVASGRAVYVNSDDKIGTLVSSRRFKDEIKPMDNTSEPILALKPVTFRYKKEIEPNSAIMFGLIAEEVEKVDPDLVTRNDKGEVETVRYDAVDAMLLNEFLKEHHKVEKLEATVAQQQKKFQATVAQLTERLDKQAAQIQKVSARSEISKFATGGIRGGGPASQMVLNNR